MGLQEGRLDLHPGAGEWAESTGGDTHVTGEAQHQGGGGMATGRTSGLVVKNVPGNSLRVKSWMEKLSAAHLTAHRPVPHTPGGFSEDHPTEEGPAGMPWRRHLP